MFVTIEKSDAVLKYDVESELSRDPSFTSSQIRIFTKNGLVTLEGTVPHLSERSRVEKAVQRVAGVKVVVDELEVNLLSMTEVPDEDIGEAAIKILECNYQIPATIKISVKKGRVTLRGSAQWDFQRNAAVDAVTLLKGVKGIDNEIRLKSLDLAEDAKSRIEEALNRSAENEGHNISVEFSGGRAVLSGTVRSQSEREDAVFATYNAPGVIDVKNDLKIVS